MIRYLFAKIEPCSVMNFCLRIVNLLFVILAVGALQSWAQEPSSSGQEFEKPESVRIYRSPEERREASLGIQVTDWLRFGGVVELEKEWKKNIITGPDNTENPDTELAIELGFEVEYEEWLEAEVLFAIEDNGRRHYQELDEGLIGVNLGDWGMKVGRLYVPFGAYYSHFISGPLLEFAQTRGDAILMDYTVFDSIELAAYAFDSKVDKREDHNEVDWGISLEWVSEDESMRMGAGYISDLSESEDELLLDFKNTFLRRVPAWNAYALIGLKNFEITAEILRATRSFREFPKNADQPFAFNIDVAYFPFQFIQVATRIEHSKELIDEPAWQTGVSVTWAPWESITVSADYLYGHYKKRFAFDDFDNPQTAHHFTALQLTWGF